jgi:hypothetical protein
MLHTIQGTYESMRTGDVTTDDTALDGETSGYTYHWHDKPSEAFELGQEFNSCEIIFTGGYECADNTANADTTDDGNFAFNIYGYTERGPAEFLCEISGTVGTARITDSTLALYVDTLTVSSQKHMKKLMVEDSGNNRIAKLSFDVLGYKYLYAEGYDVSYAPRPWIRPI